MWRVQFHGQLEMQEPWLSAFPSVSRYTKHRCCNELRAERSSEWSCPNCRTCLARGNPPIAPDNYMTRYIENKWLICRKYQLCHKGCGFSYLRRIRSVYLYASGVSIRVMEPGVICSSSMITAR